jgi:hypothetical protein
MAQRTKLWEISGDALAELKESPLSEGHVEAELEKWIVNRPELLGEDLLLIASQVEIAGVGRLDLLAIDSSGRFVIVELKRDIATRECVAQALDYASWLNNASVDEVKARIQDHSLLKEDLEDAFQARFGKSPELVCGNHRVLIVAGRPDDAAERIITYLAERHKVLINGLFFTYWKVSGDKEVLVRTVQVSEPTAGSDQPAVKPDPLKRAEENATSTLVRIFRQQHFLSACGCTEQMVATAGGSYRYWKATPEVSAKVVFGVNPSGQLANAPSGVLAVWLRPDAIGAFARLEGEEVRKKFGAFGPHSAGRMDFVIQLRSEDEAKKLAAQLESILGPARAASAS